MSRARSRIGGGAYWASAITSTTGIGFSSLALTGAGSGQSDAAATPGDINLFTTVAASTGAVLPTDLIIGDSIYIINGGANALLVYPPTGGKVNNLSANAGYSLAVNKGILVYYVAANTYIAVGA